MVETITILGGGVAGVVAAYQLARSTPAQITIIEREPQLGGLQRSLTIGDQVYDIGAFLFDKNNPFIKTFPGLCDLFYESAHINQVITPLLKIDWYPFSLRGYLRDRGMFAVMRASASIMKAKVSARKKKDLIQYISYYIGKKLYEDTGLRLYIERLYRTTDDTVDLAFGRQRISELGEQAALRKNVVKLFQRLAGVNVPEAVPWQCYVRPKGGFGVVYDYIRQCLEASNVTIRFSKTITSIRRTSDGFLIAFDDGTTSHSDRVISTIPLDQLMNYLPPQHKPMELEYMSLISLFYTFEGTLGYEGTFLFNFSTGGSWKRLSTFSRFYEGSYSGPHYFAVECTSKKGDGRTIESERAAFEEHIKTLPVLKGTLTFQGGHITANAYPFFRKGDADKIAAIRAYTQAQGIEFVGRQGNFEYIGSKKIAANVEIKLTSQLPNRDSTALGK